MGWFSKAQDEPPQKTKTPFPTKQMFILGEHVSPYIDEEHVQKQSLGMPRGVQTNEGFPC